MTYKEYIAGLRRNWIGQRVKYQGEFYTVMDVDYNGALLINLKNIYNDTTAVLSHMVEVA